MTAAKDRPILFSGPMVRSLLAGTKTQTRRIAFRSAPDGDETGTTWHDLYMDWMFRPIDGFFDYLAGRDGLIYSLKRSEPSPLNGSPTSKGYLSVSLCRKGGITTHNVHVAIASAWLGPRPSPDHEVRHLDGELTNNRIDNLDWGTKGDNWSDRRAQGNGVHEEHHAAKITLVAADEIRQSTLSQRKLAAMYGVAQSTIWAIKNGEIWRAAPPASGRNFALPDAPRLWVRETLCIHNNFGRPLAFGPQVREGDNARIWSYAADNVEPETVSRRIPAIHMPRAYSRLTDTITDVRVQRLQEISEADCIAEGIERAPLAHIHKGWRHYGERDGLPGIIARDSYKTLWNTINGNSSWDANPWICAVSFEVHHCNIDGMGK